uniref:Uncharacterized protein n=1 Tax=Cacopsylla melanoneura TaxID=428564 RepID=A0A8D8ZZY0_9HEMI
MLNQSNLCLEDPYLRNPRKTTPVYLVLVPPIVTPAQSIILLLLQVTLPHPLHSPPNQQRTRICLALVPSQHPLRSLFSNRVHRVHHCLHLVTPPLPLPPTPSPH